MAEDTTDELDGQAAEAADQEAEERPGRKGGKAAGAKTGAKKKGGKADLPKVPMIVTGVVALVVGVLLGHFALGGFGSSVSGKTTLTESELDQPLGSYTRNGKTVEFTARDVMEATSSVDNYATTVSTSDESEDSTVYSIPAASDCVSYVQNQIIYQAVEDEGITVSDDERDEYAETYAGTSDYATLASSWGISEDDAKSIVEKSCGVYKLHEEKVGTLSVTMPDAPTAAEEGQEDVATAEYGQYVVNLLGDEWDSDNETWARTDGPYYQSMSSETFTSQSATYSQAETAYYVAYVQYQTAYSEASQTWTDFVNGLLSETSINLYTAVA